MDAAPKALRQSALAQSPTVLSSPDKRKLTSTTLATLRLLITLSDSFSHLSSLTHTMRFAKTNLNISGLSVFAQLNPGNSTQLK